MSQTFISPDKKSNKLGILRWVARIGSVLCIGIVLLIFLGEPMEFALLTPTEWLMLFCFPLGVTLGMIIGWWRELIGGGITAVSLIAFYLIDALASGDLPRGLWFIIFAFPGLLFLLYGWLDRRHK